MKREMLVFLCVAVVLFLGSCADLSKNDEEAVRADLPADFNWKTYGEINNDVMMSQIVLDLKKTKTGDGDIANCVNILSNMTFAAEIFSAYLQCPADGWGQDEKCPGRYANNSNYKPGLTYVPKLVCETIFDVNGDPIPQGDPQYNGCVPNTLEMAREQAECVIDACFLGGWGGTLGFVNFLPDSLAQYLAKSTTSLGVIKGMCQFIPENSTLTEAQNYLRNFPFDSYLIEQHYHFFGRSDGRPYKYCGAAHGVEKTQSLADKRAGLNNYYYDYGRYTFCLDKNDEKIYVAQ